MQLTGLFARMQQKKISLEQGSVQLMSITDALDVSAQRYESERSRLLQDNKDIRIKNQQLHKEIYMLNERIRRLELKKDKLEEEKAELKTKMRSFEQWQSEEDSFLLNASSQSEDSFLLNASSDLEGQKEEEEPSTSSQDAVLTASREGDPKAEGQQKQKK